MNPFWKFHHLILRSLDLFPFFTFGTTIQIWPGALLFCTGGEIRVQGTSSNEDETNGGRLFFDVKIKQGRKINGILTTKKKEGGEEGLKQNSKQLRIEQDKVQF